MYLPLGAKVTTHPFQTKRYVSSMCSSSNVLVFQTSKKGWEPLISLLPLFRSPTLYNLPH